MSTEAYVPHEDPEGEYEEALDRYGLACHAYACWRAATWRRDCAYGGHLYCDEHRTMSVPSFEVAEHSDLMALER